MLKAVFFDLDGTLLPIDETNFVKGYFSLLAKKVIPFGYEEDKLIKTIWAGTNAMINNDGTRTNEEVFWSVFSSIYGEEKLKDKSIFDEFYSKEFKEAKQFCNENPYAKDIVDFCNSNLDFTILSTNPFFPRVGQQTRLSFIGLKDTDFDYVTDYSNSSFCKPNPMYFQNLLDKFNLNPEEVILFGNNTLEDGDCASNCGIKTYLINGYIINNEKAKGNYERIDMKDIVSTIKKELKIRQQ